MVGMRRLVTAGAIAAAIVGLAGCASPLLGRIQAEVARFPFTAKSFSFATQFGNAHPEWAFTNPIVKADTAGNIYVADSSFRIRKFNASGVLQSTLSGVSLLGPDAHLYDMAFDTSGNIYTVTNNPSQIQKYDASGTLLLSWGGSTLYNGVALSSPNAIAVDSAGGVYVSDRGHYRVVKFDTVGTYQSYLGVQDVPGSGSGSFQYPISIVVDRNNNVFVLDNTSHCIQKFSGGTFSLIQWGGGVATYGSPALAMSGPYALTISPGSTQYIYVIDSGNKRGLKFDTSGTFQTSSDWGSAGTGNGQFTNAQSIAVDSAGSIYVADNPGNSFSGRIQKFSASAPPTWLASWGGGAGTAPGGTAAPWGVAFDLSGNILVVDVMNSRLQKFDPTGSYLSTWGQAGTGPGDLSFPTGLARDKSGNIYISELSNSRFTVLDSSGTFLRTVGSSGSGNGFFSSPVGIAVDGSGYIYVSDSGNARVQVFGPDFNYKRQFGSLGTSDGQFSSYGNYGIAVDSAGNVYVSDYVANRIQKFDALGNFSMKWGSQGTGDGQFNAPIGMAVDAFDNVFVADMANRRIQKFDSTGKFLATFGVAGSGNGGFGWPVGVAVDAKGRIAVSDYTGALVQVFSPAP